MRVLVDSSIWIEYFRNSQTESPLDYLIEEDLVAVNDLILAELIPALHQRSQKELIELMCELKKLPLTLDWKDLIQMQITCLQNDINCMGIPDLIIAQHAIQHDLTLLSLDKHFALLSKHTPLKMY